MPLDKTDEMLAQESLANPEAFALLVERFEGKLGRYIYRISGVGKEDCEDILQEIFLKAYRNLNGFDVSLSFSSWIYRIAHNHTRSHFRKVQARPKQSEIDEKMINRLASSEDMAGVLDSKIAFQTLSGALDKLDEKYRNVLVLKYIEEKSYQEISDIIQKPIGTVGTLVNRAKKRLQKELNV